jgi:hypothetical protein
MLDKIPIPLKENRAKTVRAWARVVIHGEKDNSNILKGEGANNGGGLGGVN